MKSQEVPDIYKQIQKFLTSHGIQRKEIIIVNDDDPLDNKIQLNLSDGRIQNDILRGMLKIQQKEWPKIKIIEVNQKDFSLQALQELSRVEFPYLENLIIRNSKNGNNMLQYWLEMIKNKTLTLELIKNGLTSRDMSLFMDSIQNLKNLLEIYIIDNNIGNNGVKFLIKSDFPQLQDLTFENCDINCEGARHATKNKCDELKRFSFGDNKVSLKSKQSKYPNRTSLNFAQKLYQISSKKLQTLDFGYTQPICVIINRALVEAKYLNHPKFENKIFEKCIKKLYKKINPPHEDEYEYLDNQAEDEYEYSDNQAEDESS